MLMGEHHSVYLLAEGGDNTTAKGARMGGFGGGNIAVNGKDGSTAIPFKLSDGDKSHGRIAGRKERTDPLRVAKGP